MKRDETGTALIEFVWLALLLLIPLLYIVLAAFHTQSTAYASSAAARSASRAFLVAPDAGVATERARLAAKLSFEDQGVESGFNLRISCRPDPANCLSPGSVVTARVTSSASLPLIPGVFGSRQPSIKVEAEHSAPYGQFRQAR